jgi:nucleotide-binding universal stress UspA family protein
MACIFHSCKSSPSSSVEWTPVLQKEKDYMKNLIVAIDFSNQTQRVLNVAEQMGMSLGARIWLVHIADPDPEFVGYEAGPDVVRDQVAKKLQKNHTELQECATRLRDQGLDATALSIQGPTVDRILSEAKKLEADMIIMGSHGHGAMYRVLLGSVSEGVLHRAGVPVLIVPPDRNPNASDEQ